MLLTIIFGVSFLTSIVNSAKILAIFMVPSYSHQIVFQPIWKELSLRGHQVTVYTPFPLNDKSLTNLTEYDLSFSYDTFRDIDKAGQDFRKIFDLYEKTADMQLSHPYMLDLINNVNNDSYDVLLVEYLWQTMFAFKEVYKVPMVGITSLPLSILGSEALGMDKHPVLDPDLLMQFSYAETFKQRVFSWAYKWLYKLAFEIKLNARYSAQIKRHFGEINKSGYDLMKETNLVIGNSNFALHNVKPLTPAFIPISGIHVQPPKPLPPNLADFLNNLKNDVIYFSFGSNVRTSYLSEIAINKIFSVLGRLPYIILWKYDSDNLPKNLPKNFFVRKWFPQQDILGHPKVKLFITQGGLQSIDEALARKVPMLIIPFLGDQRTNADRCVRLGIAETIPISTLTDNELEEKLNKLLNDPSYHSNIKKQSLIATDQPQSSLDKAVFWIEYVIRHEGADHLRYGAVDLPFIQYYLLDVYLFMAVIVGFLYYVLKWLAVVLVLTNRVQKKLLMSRFLEREKSIKKEK